MPAIHDQYSSVATQPVESKETHLPSQTPERDWHMQRKQIVSHLMRGIEMQRLPEALAIRDQVFDGEPITVADRENLAQMVRIVDKAAGLLEDDVDLGRAQRSVAKLHNEILARAQANELAAVAVDSMMRSQPRQASTSEAC